jgi:hypothetical protein
MIDDRLNAQVHPAHAEVWELLPWYHNGTLGAAARQRVDSHLGECLVCTREVRRLRQLQVALAAPANDHACTQAFNRLNARIHASQRSWLGRLRALLGALVPPGPTFAGAAVVVLCAALAWAPWPRPGEGGGPTVPVPFQTLGRNENPATETGYPLLRIVVRDAEREESRSAWLARYGAEVVEGPSDIGVMTVKVALGNRHVSDVIEHMRKDEDTLFVEPLKVLGERPDRRR